MRRPWSSEGVVGFLVARAPEAGRRGSGTRRRPSGERRKLALAAGADDAFAPEVANGRVMEITGGRGADVAVETSGSGAALQSAIDAVATEGTVVVASWYGTKPVTLELGGHFHRGRVRLRSSQVGRSNPELAPRWDRPGVRRRSSAFWTGWTGISSPTVSHSKGA